jgi:hypothetical protein
MNLHHLPALCIGASLVVTGALSGCNETTLTRPGGTQVLYQNPPTEVDILLVVDNSCSMGDEQAQLSEGFDRFVEYFEVADVDYHIGVTTTDMEQDRGVLHSAGGTTFITPDTANPADVFRDNVQVGTDGWLWEKGLAAAAHALSDDLSAGANAGFLRDDALLSVIFISDEEDASPYAVNSYINYFLNLKESARRDAFNASALVGIDPDTLEPADCAQGSGNPPGGAVAAFRYHDVAIQTGGVVASICGDEFADVVSQMGLTASRLVAEFALDRRPRISSIEMRLFIPGHPDEDDDGLLVPPEGDDDGNYQWEYIETVSGEVSEDASAVPDEFLLRFTDPASLPPIDTKMVVHYEYF